MIYEPFDTESIIDFHLKNCKNIKCYFCKSIKEEQKKLQNIPLESYQFVIMDLSKENYDNKKENRDL